MNATRFTRALPWLALSGVVTMLAAGLALLLPVTAAGQPASTAVTETRQMPTDYNYTAPAGTTYNASVTVSQTKDLVRQKVKVSWSGLRPTNGAIGAANYPVVVLQCWGNKDRVTQQTCWNAGPGVGVEKLNVVFADKGTFDPAVFGPAPSRDTSMPFKARDDGKLYNGLATSAGWPDGQVVKTNPTAYSIATANAVLPNSYQGFTNADGTGETDIELLTGFENPHLGCSSTAACSLVVVPIGDPVCKPDSALPANIRGQCRAGRVTGRLASHWISPANWSRKFAFDLSFRESPTSCAIDSRPETGFSGSFYAFQVLNNSWRPKFCQDKKLFRLGYTALSDGEARGQFAGALTGTWQDGTTNALLTSRPVEGELAKPTVYAPVTVSGVAVSFVLDDQNLKEVTELNLNARLLAKMITQSYRSTSVISGEHPGLKGNPRWWGEDPEFRALNPHIPADALFAINRDGSNYPVISLGDLDSIYALTAYIAADKDAVAWLNGANDGHGMFVNPKFHEYKLPVGLLELRDDFKDSNPGSPVYGQFLLSAYANVADSIYNAAVAVAQAWPYAGLSQSCVDPAKPETCSLKRVDQRQTGGFRAMLAITSLADSKVFGLRQAALQTAPGKFVKPDDYSLALALRGTKLDEKTGVLKPDFPKMHPNAYPGMSVVYAAIPTTGLSATTARDYAKFLDYAAEPGQVRGNAMGQLPDGYVPLSDPLREQTRNAAVAVREQKGQVPAPPPGLVDDPAGGLLPPPGDNTNNIAGNGNRPATSTPASTTPPPPATSTTAPPTVDKASTTIATRTDSSGFAKWVLPGLLGVGALAGLIAFGATVWTQPQHPVRRALRAALRRS
ncbi:hypothetical protein JOF56_001319 [Kibdelosporangium banguiense]|uniref:PBP domain-containing protein n=1 Tax=Kibdelosporangium banguiense TaxID=1365924 RepID=A0ABS4TAF2_9PSEU|nr:hypothetical protein [Kibdelosporangium banguiense]MBP2320934.1 hypothetical protein [Kibdelosporangium banguiense]